MLLYHGVFTIACGHIYKSIKYTNRCLRWCTASLVQMVHTGIWCYYSSSAFNTSFPWILEERKVFLPSKIPWTHSLTLSLSVHEVNEGVPTSNCVSANFTWASFPFAFFAASEAVREQGWCCRQTSALRQMNKGHLAAELQNVKEERIQWLRSWSPQ